jgi:hypothetical protein
MKIILRVVSKAWNKPSQKDSGKEKGDGCELCGMDNHKLDTCYNYDKNKSMEENHKIYAKKLEEKKKKLEEKKKRRKEKKAAEANAEKSNTCFEREAQLYCEPCYVMGVATDEVDFVYDSGTTSGVAGMKEKEILFDVEEEHVLLEGVGGHKSMSKEYGDSIFGKTRILKNRVGSVLVSNYSTRKLYQVTNPDEDRFILRGWKNNPNTAGKTWQFVLDEERYGDKLLHCTVKMEQAKSFASKEKFYRPDRVPVIDENKEEIIAKVQNVHEQLNHASTADPGAFDVTVAEIKIWKDKSGKHCTGCIEGAMKQHAKVESSKPLYSEVPGEISAGDLMFIEAKDDVKKPMLINVDVATKLITGVSLRGRNKDECTNALLQVKAE